MGQPRLLFFQTSPFSWVQRGRTTLDQSRNLILRLQAARRQVVCTARAQCLSATVANQVSERRGKGAGGQRKELWRPTSKGSRAPKKHRESIALQGRNTICIFSRRF